MFKEAAPQLSHGHSHDHTKLNKLMFDSLVKNKIFKLKLTDFLKFNYNFYILKKIKIKMKIYT